MMLLPIQALASKNLGAYNAQFTSYEGNISGTTAKTLVDVVKQHNLSAVDNSEKIQVLTTAGNSVVDATAVSISNTDGTYLDTVSSSLQSGLTYNVSFGYDSTSNKITTVYIVNMADNGQSTTQPNSTTSETATNTLTTNTVSGLQNSTPSF